MIKPKNCGEYYFAFCVEYYIQKGEYNCYGVRIFKQDSIINTNDTLLNKIQEYLGLKGSWWLNYDEKWHYSLNTSITEFKI